MRRLNGGVVLACVPSFARCGVMLGCLALAGGCAKKEPGRPASSLSELDRAALAKYDETRAALAADDMRAAKRAAAGLVAALKPSAPSSPERAMIEPAQAVADDMALDRGREDFKTLSAAAIPIARGVSGFYVAHCPMTTNGDWVQTTETIDNPYMGKVMHDCGVIQK